MLGKKIDVDRHVEYCLKRIQSESERNLRSFAFAKLYFNIAEYEQSRRYVSNYLIAKPKSAEAHLLLGKILEKVGRREAALEAYRTSLDIDPKQNGLVLKVCELLASDDVTLDAARARFWCEQARLLDPQHPAVFDLRERLATADSNGPDDVLHLFISELEHRPTDVALRVRLLQHMLENNQLSEAYKHVSDIEGKNLSIFADHLVWYETVAKILIRYKNENVTRNATLEWQFWMLIVTVFDKLTSLSLDENVSTSKNLSDCVRTIFNFDQTLSLASENININCMEKQFIQEFLIHYRAQLCFHIATLVFKQAKKDQIKYKEAINIALPLLLISHHSQPVELQCVWLEHATESTRLQAQRWHREAAFRCSQAGHTLISLVRERRSTFTDRVAQLCTGSWRERTYKNIFITRDQQMKIKSSYFVMCTQLDEVTGRLPDSSELIRNDEVAQLVHPSSLHHMIWIGINNNPVKFRCTVFDGLQYSIRNLTNCAAETLSILDIQAFLYCCVFCAQANNEESKHLIYYNQEKPNVLPAALTEPYGTLNQTKWFSSVYKMYRNECGSDLSDIRVTLIKGIEIVRCAGAHGLDVKLLVMLANTFSQKAKHEFSKPMEVEYMEARAELYWRTALPLLEKLRNNQVISYPAKRWFEYRGKEMTPTEINMNIEEGKLFSAVQLMKKKDHERALQMLESLKNPYASFYQAQTYKLLADEQMSHNKENVTSEMRSQHIILLSKARDCLYLTLDRLREPSVDRKHPLNAELGTEIEKIERLLSRIDPDCVNRNECDGMSDENVSSVGSVGEHVNVTSSSYMMHHSNSYHNGTSATPLTPRHEHHTLASTPYRVGIGDLTSHLNNSSSRRAEARPSPERLDAQLRQMAATKDAAVTHILDQNRLVMDAHRTLVDEIRGFKDAVTGLTASVDELRAIKKSVDELKVAVEDLQNMKEAVDQVYEIKKDLAELKKDTNKLKSNQINEEDLYALEEEYGGVDYNINAGATGFNTAAAAAALYPNFPQRLQGAANTLAYGAPGLYSMYPMYPYGGLGMGQPGTLPFPDASHVPDFRAMGSIAQGLSHTGLAQNQPAPAAQLPANMFAKLPGDVTASAYGKFDNLSLNPAPLLPPPVAVTIVSQIPSSVTTFTPAPPPVNVVITASDPLPTTSVSQPVLSVTIPPQHLKGNHPKPHNYQIALPASTQPTFTNVASVNTSAPMPVATQNLLSNVAPPVYSSLTVHSPQQLQQQQQASDNASNKGLGLQIEKSLAQSFISSPNTSMMDHSMQRSDFNRSNVSEASILEEHDPCPDFKPIIPLPDEVPLNTGEENERILFCEHAKLYRYMEKEWRERGIGHIKLLLNENTGKVRVLMRRDQVHKICANHFLTADIKLTPMPNNERAYVWAANDFADENVVLEKLCVRFRSVEEAKKFADAFEYGKTLLKDEPDHRKHKTTAVENKPKQQDAAANKENSLGGFVFTSTPTFKPKTDLKQDSSVKQAIDTTPKLSPFAGFTFGSPKSSEQQIITSTNSEFKPVQKPITEPVLTPKQIVKQHGEEDEDFVPTTEFKPVIPLPDLIDVKTGEENSEVLFEVKAKLLRFDSDLKEWKERGVGIVKILKEKTVRLLMRREQVHKVCCNHQLLKRMVFTNMPNNNRVLNWCAQDFSEGVLKPEMFAIRFRTSELCDEFLNTIQKAQEMLDSSNNVISGAALSTSRSDHSTMHKPTSGWGDTFKMKSGSWECAECYVTNDGTSDKCIACASTQPNSSDCAQSPQKFKPSPVVSTQQTSPWNAKSKPKSNTWQCKVCSSHNDGKHNYCEACDSPKNGTVPKKDASVDLNASGQQFSFGIQAVNLSSPQTATSKSTVTTTTSGWGDLYKPKTGAWNCQACYLSNDGSAIYCIACESPKDDTIPKKENKGLDLDTEQKFTFGIPSAAAEATTTAKPVTESIFGAKSAPTAGFTFGMNQTAVAPPATGFSFGTIQKPITTPSITIPSAVASPMNLAAKTTFSFSLNTTATEPVPVAKEEFVFGSPNKHEFEFKPRSPRKVSGGDGDNESDGSGAEEECDNIYFKPVIPLPDKVEVRTGEEQEQAIYCHRAKLFRYCDGEWKERGIGDVKILKHAESGKLRVLMRREQVHKICLNHSLTTDLEYKAKDDKTWLFTAPDYSDGEISYLQFCLRFKNAEIAKQFMDAVNGARNDTQIDSKPTATEKPKQDTDSDLEIVYELKVSRELEEKALALQLPKNFYAYLQNPPCKGCIGCNDDNFVFSTPKSIALKPKVEFSFGSKPTTKTETPEQKSNIFGGSLTKSSPSVFGTPLSTSIFSGTNSSNTNKSTGSSTFSFATPGSDTKSFSSPFTANIFSAPATQSPSIFSGGGSMMFGSTTITPIKNDAPTLTSLLTQPNIIPVSVEHKSPLAPSKLANVQSQSGNIFSGSPTGNIFGGNKSRTTENTTPPLSQTLSTNKTTSQPSTIFGGTNTLLFGTLSITSTTAAITTTPTTTNQNSGIFSGAAVAATPTNKLESTNMFSGACFGSNKNSGNIFGGSGASSVFGAPSQPPVFSSGFSFTQSTKPDLQSTGDTNKTEPIFSNISAPTTFSNLSTAPTFGPVAAQTKQKEPEIILKCDSNLSFAALASTTTQQTPFVPTDEQSYVKKPFSFAGAGTPVFGSAKPKTDTPKTAAEKKANTTGGDNDNQDAEDGTGGDALEEYDPHYEPIVPLPDAIVVKTGEEDETIVYNERAKLYRFNDDTKEWKERGVGQIKLLHHPVNDTYRLLMRREQVHKLVLNQLVTVDMNLQTMQTSDRAWLWAGYNHSEDGSTLEKLSVRFSNSEMANQFRDAVLVAQEYLSTKPVTILTEQEREVDEQDDEEDEEYGSDDSDENTSIMFSKRCTLSYKTDESSDWKILGMGEIKMFYDSEVYGGRVKMCDDSGEQLCNSIIATNTIMKMEDTCCIWRSMEWSLVPPVPRILKAQFGSNAAAQEMYYNYEEAMQYAQHSQIVDSLP